MKKTKFISAVISRAIPFTLLLLAVSQAPAQQTTTPRSGKNDLLWTTIAGGVEYSTKKISDGPVAEDGILHLVRIDPLKATLRLLMASALGKQQRTAQQWCTEFGMTAVINAGMFQADHLTHVGFMRSGNHINNAKWAKEYNSILLFDPVRPGIPIVQIADNVNDISSMRQEYGTVIQNIRLIKGDGVNVWKEQLKKWSEAAIAMDGKGRILFLFVRSPLSMHEFNTKILTLPLDIKRAMHLEGGPEASMSICTANTRIHLAGSLETGLLENSGDLGQWSIPNVIGVAAGH
jgi:phosphodiester glycosidase